MNNKSTFFGCKGIFFLCAIALAVVGLAFVGCSDPTGGGSFSEPAYSGEFTMSGPVTGSDTVVFELDSIPARAAASSTGLSGKLKDKNGVYRLSGTYAPESGAVKLSANGVNFRYIISGAFDDTGAVVAHSALVFNKASATSATFEVVEHSGGPIGGDAQAGRDDENVIPEQFVGAWELSRTSDSGTTHRNEVLISPYSLDFAEISSKGTREGRIWVALMPVEVTPQGDGSYDVIVVAELGLLDSEQKKDAVNALFQSYLQTKNITATRTFTNNGSEDVGTFTNGSTAKEYYIALTGVVWCNNFQTDPKWLNLLSVWRKNNLSSRYMKFNLSINNGKLTLSIYEPESEDEDFFFGFETIEGARDVTTSKPSIPGELTRR